MSIGEFFRTINWAATLQVSLIRIGVASLLWVFIMLISGAITDASSFFGMIITWLVILTVAMVVAIPAMGLTRAHVPIIGLLALPAWLVVIGDPIVRILWKVRPGWVPVSHFKFINPPVLAIFMTDEDKIPGDDQTSSVDAPSNADSAEKDEDDPVHDLLMTCDRSPSEGLAWISRLDESLQSKPMIMFARFVALRHLAIDESFLSKGSPNIGSVAPAEIEKRMTSEHRSFADQALIQVAKLDSVDHNYIRNLVSDNEHFAESMVDDICTINERLFPGKVQKVLGWTKLSYFGKERLGKAPNIFDESDDSLFRKAIRQRIRPPKMVLSAVSYNKGIDDNNRTFIDTFLMEKDFRQTPTMGDANIFCSVRVFEDGEVVLSDA